MKNRYLRFLNFVLIVFLGNVIFFTGGFNLGGGRAPYFSNAPVPEGSDWYIDLQYGLTESHYHVLYRGLGPSIENARKADVLILGDSRALLTYDWRQIEAFSQSHGVTFFNLGIDGGTGWEFALAIMKRHGLRPKAVVLALPEFISNPTFQAAQETLDTSLLTSVKYVLSGETIWRIKNTLDTVCEPLLAWLYPHQSFLSTYRSTKNGCWFRDGWIDDSHYTIEPALEPCGKEHALPAEFMEYLSAAQTAIVVGYAPASGYCPSQAVRLAQQMGGESVAVFAEDLTTYDHGHLDKASAERYTARFLQAFLKTAAFRAITQAKIP